jgi:hypothetical protein
MTNTLFYKNTDLSDDYVEITKGFTSNTFDCYDVSTNGVRIKHQLSNQIDCFYVEAMTLECVLDTLRCENLNHEFDMVLTADINDLIEALYQQGKDYLNKVKEFKDSAEGVA